MSKEMSCRTLTRSKSMICDDCAQTLSSEEEPHYCQVRRSERLVTIDEMIRQEQRTKAWEARNRFNFDVQDNNPADPEQADLDDVHADAYGTLFKEEV